MTTSQETKFITLAKAEIEQLETKLQLTSHSLDEDKLALDSTINHLEMMGSINQLREKYNIELKSIVKQQELARLAHDDQLKILASLRQQIDDLKQQQKAESFAQGQKKFQEQKKISEERLAQNRAYQSILLSEGSRQSLFRSLAQPADLFETSVERQKAHSEIEENFQKQHEAVNQNLVEVEKGLSKENERLTELQETVGEIEKQQQAILEKINNLEEELTQKNLLAEEINQHQERLRKAKQEVETLMAKQEQEQQKNAENLMREKKQTLLDEKNKIKKILEDFVSSEEDYFIKRKDHEIARQADQELLIKKHNEDYQQCMEKLHQINSSLEALLLKDSVDDANTLNEIALKRQELQETEQAILDLTTQEQHRLEQCAEEEKRYLAEMEFHAKQSKRQKDQYFTELQLIAASLAEFTRNESTQLTNTIKEIKEKNADENQKKLNSLLEELAGFEQQQTEIGQFIFDDKRFVKQLHKEYEKLNEKKTLTEQTLSEQSGRVKNLIDQQLTLSTEQKHLEKSFFQEKQAAIALEQLAKQQQSFRQELIQNQNEYYVKRLNEQQSLIDKAVQKEQVKLAELEKQGQLLIQKSEEEERHEQKMLLDLEANKEFTLQLIEEQESLIAQAELEYDNLLKKQEDDINTFNETQQVLSNQKIKIEEKIKHNEASLIELKNEKEKLDALINVEYARLQTVSSVVSQPEKEQVIFKEIPKKQELAEGINHEETLEGNVYEVPVQDSPAEVIRQKLEAMRKPKVPAEKLRPLELSEDSQSFHAFIAEMTRRKNVAEAANAEQQSPQVTEVIELSNDPIIHQEGSFRSEPKSNPETETRPDIIAYKALIAGIKGKQGSPKQIEVSQENSQNGVNIDDGLRGDIEAFEQIALANARKFASGLSFMKRKQALLEIESEETPETASEVAPESEIDSNVHIHTIPAIESSPTQMWQAIPTVHLSTTPDETRLTTQPEQHEEPIDQQGEKKEHHEKELLTQTENALPLLKEIFPEVEPPASVVSKNENSEMKAPKKPLYEDLDFITGSKKALLNESSPWSNSLLYGIILFFIVALLWANFAIVDQTIVAEGKVIPSMQVYDVQSLDGGVLAELYVQEGQKVNKGQILLRIDNKRFGSSYQEAEKRKLGVMGEIARLSAESNGAASVTFPDEVKKLAPDVVIQQTQLFQTRKTQLAAAISTTQRSYDLATQELKITQPLVKEGLMSQLDLLRLQREINQLRGEMQNKTNQFRSDAQQQLSTKQAELAPLLESVGGLKDRSDRTTLSSPIAGTVKKIYLDPGEVVEAAKNVLEIVPTEETLLIEAKVKPIDIGFVHINDNATVKVTAYDYSIYGGLEGKVIYVSADSIQNDKNPEQTYYIIRVRTPKSYLVRNNQQYSIIPGMTVVVDVKGARKSVLDYLLKPFLKTKEEAFREH